MNEAGELVKNAVRELSETIQSAGSEVVLVNALMDEVTKASARVGHGQLLHLLYKSDLCTLCYVVRT